MKKNIKNNENENIIFIKKWAKYIRESKNLEWSTQQNILINSMIKNAKNIKLTREQYLRIKGEKFIE